MRTRIIVVDPKTSRRLDTLQEVLEVLDASPHKIPAPIVSQAASFEEANAKGFLREPGHKNTLIILCGDNISAELTAHGFIDERRVH